MRGRSNVMGQEDRVLSLRLDLFTGYQILYFLSFVLTVCINKFGQKILLRYLNSTTLHVLHVTFNVFVATIGLNHFRLEEEDIY